MNNELKKLQGSGNGFSYKLGPHQKVEDGDIVFKPFGYYRKARPREFGKMVNTFLFGVWRLAAPKERELAGKKVRLLNVGEKVKPGDYFVSTKNNKFRKVKYASPAFSHDIYPFGIYRAKEPYNETESNTD